MPIVPRSPPPQPLSGPFPLSQLHYWFEEAQRALRWAQDHLAGHVGQTAEVEQTRLMYLDCLTDARGGLMAGQLPTCILLQLNEERARLAADITRKHQQYARPAQP